MRYLLTSLLGCLIFTASAFNNGDKIKSTSPNKNNIFKQNCAPATAQSELNINNVRATLGVGGDLWRNGSEGGYIVPQVAPGEPEVSSIFAGAIWLGGFDAAGNLKLAAQQDGTSNGTSDYWPGPLTDFGTTEEETCRNWDRIFTVNGKDIDLHLAQFAESLSDSTTYDVSTIPNSILEWPGLGNAFFFGITGFELPNAAQGLAPFWDENGDGLYTPQFGDYPVIEVRGCPSPTYPDEMKFWIFNDAGNIHTESGGDLLSMEIQAQSFAFATADAVNDMTFTRYKLINRAQESLQQTIFGLWLDPDLGCGEDDYVGVDTTRNLMYVYNQDAVDGINGSTCPDGTPTYENEVPYLGVDFFRGPLAPKEIDENGELVCPPIGAPFDTIVEIGLGSFIYFNNSSATSNDAMTAPSTPLEYYNYLSGRWKDGTPLTFGGSGLGGSVQTKFAFHDEPTNEDGWSMCTENSISEDRKTVFSSNPFRLDPGQINEVVIGIPWVPDVTYPCPDMGRLFEADDLAQRMFNSCFDILDGPDAPDLELISADQKIIGLLTNNGFASNNRQEGFELVDPLAPESLPVDEVTYKFEGYLVYQLIDEVVTQADLDDPEKARLVFQSDRENQVMNIFNWEQVPNPNAGPLDNPIVFNPVLQVEGENVGVRTSFETVTDLFTGAPLINEETYHYMAIAYAFNEWAPFDPVTQSGQTRSYLPGRCNVKRYSATPRGIANQDELPDYGDQPIITRLDGQGAGNNFISITNAERERIFEAQVGIFPAEYNGTIVYKRERAPILVQVIDPLNLIEGQYILRFDQEDDLEFGQSAWELFDGPSNQSLGRATQNLENQNEQIFEDLGFSIILSQTDDAGDKANDRNGAIGQTITYADPDKAWFTPVPDNAPGIEELDLYDVHFQATAPGEINNELDPFQSYTNLGTGHFAPYTLMDWSLRDRSYITPAWLFPQSNVVQVMNPLEELNNVDIVFTNDKTKWSRCVVIETGNRFFADEGFELDDEKENFEVVGRPSVGKEDADGDGRPDPDGTGIGFAWFPGYAIDVETGTRLNLFFGENSAYGDNTVGPQFLESINGSDMMFNPSAQTVVETQPGAGLGAFNSVLGGMHYVYVTKQAYDECEFINEKLNESFTFRRTEAVRLISWAAVGLGASDVPLLSYQEGLIPTETVVSLRVDNPYNTSLGTNDNASFPSYGFEIDNETITSTASLSVSQNQLDEIRVFPNPAMASSNVVNVTNLPSQSTVTIYNLYGKFVKQVDIDENIQTTQSHTFQWDLKNANGAFVPSGAYFIHVRAEGLGERVLKVICINGEG